MTQHHFHKYKPFQAAYGLKYRHFQTIYSTLFRKFSKADIEIERFELSDGDFVDCYWHHKADLNKPEAIVILFHGLAGSFHSPYIQGMMKALAQAGFNSVLMHFRGCSGQTNRLARSYHSGDTADAREWIEALKARYPQKPLFAIGYSLGGNMLLKLLGEWQSSSLLCAAVSVSAPLQLNICAKQMNQGFSRLYQYVLLKILKQGLLEKYKQHDIQSLIGINEKKVKQLKSFWAFDDVYTGPIHGFHSASDYYQQSSSRQYLKDISTPTLIIHAEDDPFMTPEILPDKGLLPADVQLEIHANGGHLGFISGHILKPEYWLEDRIIHFLKNYDRNYVQNYVQNYDL